MTGADLPEDIFAGYDDEPNLQDRGAVAEIVDAGPLVVCWRDLDLDETAEELERLHEWVSWLVGRYELTDRLVPDCWWRHGALVEELSALRHAWHASFDAADSGAGPIGWHERFALLRDRIERAWYKGACRGQHLDAPPRNLPPIPERAAIA